MRLIIILAISLFAIGGYGQSEYIDLDYGVDGSALFGEVDGISLFFYHFGVDSNQSVYYSALWNNEEGRRYLFKKLDPEGQLLNWGIDMDIDTSVSRTLWDFEFCWIENDNIFSYRIEDTIENGDTFNITKRYDLDFNEEVTYKTTMPAVLGLAWYSGSFMDYDSQGRLYVRCRGSIKRFRSDGQLDTSFGDGGSLKVFDVPTNYGLLQLIYNDVELRNDTIIYSGVFPSANDTTNTITRITKIDLQGNTDLSFGDQGYLELEKNVLITTINHSPSNELNIITSKYERDICPKIVYNLQKTTIDGKPVSSYGYSGYLIDPAEDCTIYNYLDNLEGPDGEILATYTDSISETQSVIKLVQFDSNGQRDYSFGEEGELNLNSIVGRDAIGNLLLDKAYNLYVVNFEDHFVFDFIPNKVFVTKLKAKTLWPNITATAADPLELLLYPNPSIGSPRLLNEGRRRTDLEVSVFDVTGRLISIKDIADLSTNTEVPVTESYLSAGTYLVKISDAISRSTYWEKIVIVE